MAFDVVVAHDLNQGIGINNTLPWHCKADMSYFKALTTDAKGSQENTVIMGRKTWESIPDKFRPLPGRKNIVLSKSQPTIEGAIVASSLDDALEKAEAESNIFVIGGGQLYQEAIQHIECNTLHVTKIFSTFECDAHFPDYSNFNCTFASNIWVTKTVNCAFFRYKKPA